MSERPKHHPHFSPSKLDLLAKCTFFKSAPAGEAAFRGTLQHEYAEAMLLNDTEEAEHRARRLEPSEKENADWYVEYVRANASGELEIEKKGEYLRDDFTPLTWGTIDALSGNEIFDYKSDSVERRHELQMAAYAVMAMQSKGIDQIVCHLCYGKLRKVVKLQFALQEARDKVEAVIDSCFDPNREPQPCEYCSWCQNAVSCQKLSSQAAVVAANYAPEQADQIAVWNPSEVSDPSVVSRMLALAQIVEPWVDAVKKHAKIMLEAGNEVQGWTLSKRSGKRNVTNIIEAFTRCGLPQDVFLKTCAVKIGELETVYAAEKGVKKAEAKRKLKEILEDIIEESPSYSILISTSTKE